MLNCVLYIEERRRREERAWEEGEGVREKEREFLHEIQVSGGREGGREGEREGGKEGRMEGGREGRKDGGRERGREGRKEGRRE